MELNIGYASRATSGDHEALTSMTAGNIILCRHLNCQLQQQITQFSMRGKQNHKIGRCQNQKPSKCSRCTESAAKKRATTEPDEDTY